MHYLPLTEEDKKGMLHEIGVADFNDLLRGIPDSLREPKLNIPSTLSEAEVAALFTELGRKNQNVKETLSFLGGGSYEHYIPSAVGSIIGRHEFYTAYTPYQAEASQGSLQAIFEFQSLVSELFDLDVSNASHYDGSTSMAEAAILALRHTGRPKILASRAIHPHYRQVLKTYLEGPSYVLEEVPPAAGSRSLDRKAIRAALDDQVAAVIVQTPNFFGVVEDLEGLAAEVHATGALLILAANPISLGVLKSPGEWGADIAVGEGQPLGLPPHLGGPYLGLFATTKALMRRIPGRLAGLTVDQDGKRAFCLTLQAREQHIRRERATSNICTNQALCALAACVYMTLLGKQGIREIGEINMDRAHYLKKEISKLDGFSVNLEEPVFNEFCVQTDKGLGAVFAKLQAKGIFAGLDLSPFYPELKNQFLVCATETKDKKDLDRFVRELAQC